MPSYMFLVISIFIFTGCAIHYFDRDTQAEHIWGIGHMTLKAAIPKEGHRAVVHGTTLAGFSLGYLDEGAYVSLGWEKRQRIEILDPNTTIRLEWPRGDLLNVRVGSKWPFTELNNSKGEGK